MRIDQGSYRGRQKLEGCKTKLCYVSWCFSWCSTRVLLQVSLHGSCKVGGSG